MANEPETQVVVNVDVSRVLRERPADLLGLNINYWLDRDDQRLPGAKPLANALNDMGIRHLRYPGGDKSDANLWALPPYDKPGPVLAVVGPEEWPSNDSRLVLNYNQWKSPPMDFDEFMSLCRDMGAEPTVVICYDAMYGPKLEGHVIPTREQLLETAAAWVYYANVVKGYGVKYWEIGNESYIKGRNNRLGVRAKDYAHDLVEFSAAMKQFDPTIQIGANGPNGMYAIGDRDKDEQTNVVWWQEVLSKAGNVIDFLAIHPYPCWKWMKYDTYYSEDISGELSLTYAADQALAALRTWAPQHADRIWLAVTEVNSADWWGHPQQLGWSHKSSLGHGLVLFDILGEFFKYPQIRNTIVWNTRWLKADGHEIWDALDEANHPLPTGQALAIWSSYLENRLVSAEPTQSTTQIKAFATHDVDTNHLTVFLLNKCRESIHCSISIDETTWKPAPLRVVHWMGTGPDDECPEIRDGIPVETRGDGFALHLPPVSLTIVSV